MQAQIVPDLQALAVPIERLHPTARNPRRGDVASIARSLEAFGQHKALVATRDGEVIIGNHTLLAALQLKWDQIAVVWVDDDAATARARLLADNKTSERGRTVVAEAAELLAEIAADEEELLAATGYESAEIDALLRLVQPPEPTVEVVERASDDSPTPPPDDGSPRVYDRQDIWDDDREPPPGATGESGPMRLPPRAAPDQGPASVQSDRAPVSNRPPDRSRVSSGARPEGDEGRLDRDRVSNGGPDPRLFIGDCREVLDEFEDETFDCIITDPGIGDSGDRDGWVKSTPGVAFWAELNRVAKPGTSMAIFANRRYWHRVGWLVEEGGWEPRDTLVWAFPRGMPMSLDMGQAVDRKAGGAGEPWFRRIGAMTDEEREGIRAPNEWCGWGTELRPSWEPICIFRKPPKGTLAENLMRYGTGAINIDASRIEGEEREAISTWIPEGQGGAHGLALDKRQVVTGSTTLGRWPANLILEHHPDCRERCQEGCPVGALNSSAGRQVDQYFQSFRTGQSDPPSPMTGPNPEGQVEVELEGSMTGHSVPLDSPPFPQDWTDLGLIFTPKASRAERTAGLPPGVGEGLKGVKPQRVLEWLLTLLAPPGGLVLDPFCGSGSTGVAATRGGWGFVGIDTDRHLINQVAARRISATKGR